MLSGVSPSLRSSYLQQKDLTGTGFFIPALGALPSETKSYLGLLFPRAFIVPETPTTKGAIGVPEASEIRATAA
jgi:hypothetical protein